MVVTDHDSYKGYEAYLEFCDEITDFVVLRGVEYDTFDYGHILVVLPSNTPESVYRLLSHRGMALRRLIHIVHGYGGILGPAHPFGEKFMSFATTRRIKLLQHMIYLKKFDFVEGYNCCESDKRNRLARVMAANYKLPLFGGSDAHNEKCVGLAGAYLPAYIDSEDSLIKYIKQGNHPKVGGSRYDKTLKDRIGPVGKVLTYGFSVYNMYGAFINYRARCFEYHDVRRILLKKEIRRIKNERKRI
jgi:predicted metal-dependent phosphoesterase TrpH